VDHTDKNSFGHVPNKAINYFFKVFNNPAFFLKVIAFIFTLLLTAITRCELFGRS
jgi:hypothetical protein